MSRRTLERLLFAFSAGVLGLAAWFWARQVQDVIELLRMASG